MRLLQLNIWMGKLLRQVLELIEKEKPDILCLQEVYSSGDILIGSPDIAFSSLEVIQQHLGYEYAFFAPAFSLDFEGVKLGFGNAIISRYPLLDQSTLFVNGTFTPGLDITQPIINVRNLQQAGLNVDGKEFTVANHHGYWDKNPLGNEKSVEAMQKVANSLKQASGPIVFSGDLNVSAESPAMRVFDNFLDDLIAKNDVPDTLSSLNRASNVACDHIMTSPEIKVNKFRVLDDLVSDHRALVLDFEV